MKATNQDCLLEARPTTGYVKDSQGCYELRIPRSQDSSKDLIVKRIFEKVEDQEQRCHTVPVEKMVITLRIYPVVQS